MPIIRVSKRKRAIEEEEKERINKIEKNFNKNNGLNS